MPTRAATADRKTTETQIALSVDVDGSGRATLATGIPFLDHMLDQVARHGMLDLDIRAKGDLQIDPHHTVEDIGITLGQAVARAVGDKKGIRRYGHAYVPLDEALSRVVIDFSGRPGLEYHVQFKLALIGCFDVDLVHEFFQGFANHAQVTLHIDNLRGDNAHYQCKTMMRVVPTQVVDMQRLLGVIGKTLEEFVHQVHVEVADQRALELDVVLEARPAGEIDHDARQRLVERYVGMPVAPDAFLVTDGARHRLAQRDPDVLHRVMGVHLQVALCPNIEIEHPVARNLFEHVIEKRNARREGRPPAAVDVDRKGDLRLGGLGIGGERAPGAARGLA